MKCVLRAWGQLKRGFEVLARVEMCCEGMGALAKRVSGVHLDEVCFEGMGGVEKGVGGVGTA